MKRNLLLILTLAFTAASCNTLFSVGTGSMGVFRSNDLGDTFHAVNTINNKNNLNSTSVNTLVFEPGNTTTMYLGSAGGVYQTQNQGDAWKLLVTNILISDIAVDPTDVGTIYAAGLTGNHGKIIETSDKGSTWHDVYTEPTQGNTVTSIALDPLNNQNILAGLATGEIIQSLDAGATWQIIDNLHDRILRIRFGPDHMPYILTYSNGLYVSRDNSKTFTYLTSTLTSSIIDFNSNLSAVSQFLDLAFDQQDPTIIYLATTQGLLRTVNSGTNWSYMSMPVRNSELRTSAVAVAPDNSNRIYAAVGDTMFESTNGGVTWQTKPLSTAQEVRMILIDQTTPNVIYLGLGARK